MDKKWPLVLAIGLLAGGMIGYTAAPADSVQGDTSHNAEGLGIADSGPMCLAEADLRDSGWVHTTATGEQYGVTFDVAVSHAEGEHATIKLNHVHGGEHKLQITTAESSGTPSDTVSENECDVGTRLSGGGELPTDYEYLTITVNGEEVAQMENEGTTPQIESLEIPLSA